MKKLKHSEINIRGIHLKLMTYNRSLKLCSKMNYETENLDFIDRIKPNEVFYDLGACEGRFSLYAALKGIRVVCFEPEDKNFKVLKQNIELNEIYEDRLKAIHAAVGDENGKTTLNIGQPWEGGHQKIVKHKQVRHDLNFDFACSQQIDVISIDSFIEDGKYPFPDYLKIDIDGSEMPFLKGAGKTLSNKQLKALVFELNEIDPNFQNIIYLLHDYGFDLKERFNIPNEPNLYNIIFTKKQ